MKMSKNDTFASIVRFTLRGIKKELRREWKKWITFMRKDFLVLFLFYAGLNFGMTLGYIFVSPNLGSDLGLKPQPILEPDRALFLMAITLLPISLFFEDLGIRFMPYFIVFRTLHLNSVEAAPNPEKRPWRLWLYHNAGLVFIVGSALWHTLLHQMNVFQADLIGRLLYLAIQFVGGFVLAWIYRIKGFWACYTIHVVWDYTIVGIAFVTSLVA